MEPAILHVWRELERLDQLLHREIMRLRARYHLSLDEFRGLYISDQQVDDLLRGMAVPFSADDVTAQAEAIRARNEQACDRFSDWGRIAAEFQLSPVEVDLLVLALGPELDSKYETLYGYVNNDVTRKFATRELARRLFADRGAGAVDYALARGSTLFRSGLLIATPSDRGFQANGVLTGYVLTPNSQPASPLRRVALESPMEGSWLDHQTRQIMRVAALLAPGAVLMFTGNRGAGRLRAAEGLCRQAQLGLLVLDARDVKLEAEAAASLATAVALQARLEHAALYIENGEVWTDAEFRPHPAAKLFLRGLDRVALCIAWPMQASWRELTGHQRVFEVAFPPPPLAAREAEWVRAISALQIEAELPLATDLARQFVFTAGQIADASRLAADTLALEARPMREAFFAAARAQSTHELGKLAQKVVTTYRWNDLVLPAATASQVREVAAAIRNRGLVYDEWGVSPGSGNAGVNVLFSGSSGTGKTMSAAIIAAEAGVDLYRIDLAGVVSKYIGETEKNLDRIFTAARCSNAILFFDEADALFGKRSEVRDAHDRYANIEVAYLLQKLEAHDQAIILASNLARNVDEAFARRIQFHVEFPIPGEPQRARLWRGMFPSRAPLGKDVDFAFLARQFQLTGGQIRTVSVDAAFLAAADGGRITMPLIIKAVARHFVHQGRMPTVHEFREYYSLANGTI